MNRKLAASNILKAQAAENRATLTVMRRLVPTDNEVPALLEEVSTAARRAGLDVGGVVPDAVIPGDQFDTYRYKVTMIGGYHQFGEFLVQCWLTRAHRGAGEFPARHRQYRHGSRSDAARPTARACESRRHDVSNHAPDVCRAYETLSTQGRNGGRNNLQ